MGLEYIANLLENLNPIAKKYRLTRKDEINKRFNVFKLISQKYHYENFHSDIIFHLLNPNSNHKQGRLFLNEFIRLLREKDGNIPHFEAPKLHRELGHIDISIRDEISKKSIIIESKINDAPDMEDQLTRYFDHEVSNEYDVVAIIYLSMNGDKNPPLCKQEVQNRVIKLAANDETNVNLYGWLKNCISEVNDPDVQSFAIQYSHLFKILSKQIMDENILKEFFEKISDDETAYMTAIAIKDMVNELPSHLAKNFSIKYKKSYSDVFNDIFYYDGEGDELFWTVMENSFLLPSGFDLKIDVWVKDPESVEISVFTRNGFSKDDLITLKQLKAIKNGDLELKANNDNDFRYRKVFKYPKEQHEIDILIESLCEDLRSLKNKQVASMN